jgi:hypothetical protein
MRVSQINNTLMVIEAKENGVLSIEGQATRMSASRSNTSRTAVCLVVVVCMSLYLMDLLIQA